MLRHKMTIVVKAIAGGSNSGSILKEVIHRNSKMNREEIDRKMHWLGSCGGECEIIWTTRKNPDFMRVYAA